MEKVNFKLAPTRESDPENFIGEVDMKLMEELGSREQKIYYVTFKNGARTKLHYHESEQILIADHGMGFVAFCKSIEMKDGSPVIQEMKIVEMERGDSICIPPSTLHWHGARKNQEFSHISIRSVSPGGRSVWENDIVRSRISDSQKTDDAIKKLDDILSGSV